MFDIVSSVLTRAAPLIASQVKQGNQAPATAPGMAGPAPRPVYAPSMQAQAPVAPAPAAQPAANPRQMFKQNMQRRMANPAPAVAAQPVNLPRYAQATQGDQGLPRMVPAASAGQPSTGGGWLGAVGRQISGAIQAGQTDVRGFAPVDDGNGFGRGWLGRWGRRPASQAAAPAMQQTPPPSADYANAWNGW